MVKGSAVARAQAVAEYQLKQAFELGAGWVDSLRKTGNTAEIEQATSAFLELAELACKHGVQLPGYTLEPGSRLDAKILTDLVNAVRPKRRNGLHIVASNGKRVNRELDQG